MLAKAAPDGNTKHLSYVALAIWKTYIFNRLRSPYLLCDGPYTLILFVVQSGQPIPDGIDDGENCVMLNLFCSLFCLETWVDKQVGGGASSRGSQLGFRTHHYVPSLAMAVGPS